MFEQFLKRETEPGLSYFDVEVSYGGYWVSLESDRYAVHAESFANTSKSYRRIVSQSPVVAGDMLIHSVPDMVNETVKVLVYGADQVDLIDNALFLTDDLFGQFSYEMRITKDLHVETMLCQQATQSVMEAGHVQTHNLQATVTITVPRYPSTSRERTG